MVPPLMIQSLAMYRDHKRPTGGCLRAILSGDLFGACGRADSETAPALHEIAHYIIISLPAESYGSREKVDAWLASRGAG